MGVDWFDDKLQKYKGVRTKMSKDGAHIDELVEIELERFRNDEERAVRMKIRADAIRQETSEIRKALLQAHQFIDEFS